MAESTPLDLVTPHAQHGMSCVCDLQDRVPVASNLLSYHLKVLSDAGYAAKRLAAALPVSEAGARA